MLSAADDFRVFASARPSDFETVCPLDDNEAANTMSSIRVTVVPSFFNKQESAATRDRFHPLILC